MTTKAESREARFPIVGAHYRPPATAILKILSTGASLILRPEPTNPVDPHAKAVIIKTSSLCLSSLNPIPEVFLDAIHQLGLTTAEFENQEEWPLGYIPAALNQFPLDTEILGTFSIGVDGKARIRVFL